MATRTQWHAFAADKVLVTLKTNKTTGLLDTSIKTLQERYGLNELPKEERFTLIHSILEQVKSPLSLVLIIAGVATLVLGEHVDTIVIFAAVLVNIVVGVLQEGKAARVFESLAASQEQHATVVRNGKQQVIQATQLVPGDIIILQGGALIPADIRILESNNLHVNEAALTGEWLPVAKVDTPVSRALPVQEQKNMAWMGTLVAEGSGRGVVVATGSRARFGQIAEATNTALGEKTPLQKSIQSIAHFLMGLIGAALVIILVLGVVRGEPFVEMLLLAIAVAVAAMPEGLPAAVTVVLALGMEAILRKGGLVKSLLAAETLGSTTVVLTDKTGTLTQGRMLLSGLYTADVQDETVKEVTGDAKELLKMAVLSSDAFVEEDPEHAGTLVVRGRPLEKAIVEAGLEAGLAQRDLFANGFSRVDFVQFESSRRYAISLNDCPQKGNRLYLSGSPEHLLARSGKYMIAGRERKLDDATRALFADTQARISAQGMRFTAVAYMRTESDTVPEEVVSPTGGEQFVFVGLISFADAVREDVPAAIAETLDAGARVIMATGDYPETARAIAREVGIDTRENAPVLTGVMIEDMTDDELLTALSEHKIVARVLPEQKLRIARVLRNSGEIVSMTGDGVNDAPALAAADIGVAVGSGTDVAKAAADLVLIDNSFAVITTAIREGRRIVSNLRKTIGYLLSTSFSEIVVIGGALAAGAPLPLLPTQILWANMVGEGLMSFPLAFEPAEADAMKKKPERRDTHGIATAHVKWFIFLVSAITGAFLLAVFFLLLWGGVGIEKIRTVVFVTLSISAVLYTFSFKDLTKPLWRIPLFKNMFLLVALCINSMLLVVALTFTPLRELLSLTTLSLTEVAILLGVGALNLFAVEVAKLLLARKYSK